MWSSPNRTAHGVLPCLNALAPRGNSVNSCCTNGEIHEVLHRVHSARETTEGENSTRRAPVSKHHLPSSTGLRPVQMPLPRHRQDPPATYAHRGRDQHRLY